MTGRPHAGRRDALRGLLRENDLDGLLVSALVNVRYLTGFTGTAGALLVTADGDRFVTDDRYAVQAETEVPDLPATITRGRDWLPDAVAGARRLGLEAHRLPWTDARAIADLVTAEVVPAAGLVETLRAVKDDEEIALIARACAIADAAFADLLEELRPGVTEQEVAAALEHGMRARGAESAAFPSIVASGAHGARPHHRPGERPLAGGDLVTLDFGACVEGYRSDMTRLVALGHMPDDLAPVVRALRRAQAAGLDAVAAGTPAAAVDAACRDLLDASGYGEAFVHPTGHGIGLEAHEAPRIAAGEAGTLNRRAVITVEPGVYLPGLGGARIEDTLVVEDGGPVVLTKTPKDVIVV